MLRHGKRIAIFVLVLGLLLAPHTTHNASAISRSANRSIESIGWILTFDLDSDQTEPLNADFLFMLKYQNSPADYDLTGSVQIKCAPSPQVGKAQHCSIPDMAALIYEASGRKVDIRKMALPLGTLEACGQITRDVTPKDRTQPVDILSAASAKLYALRMTGGDLVLSHARRGTTTRLPYGTTGFHLLLPDTTLTAPQDHTLDIVVNTPGMYRLDQLTVVDPGAFAHLHEQGCSRY